MSHFSQSETFSDDDWDEDVDLVSIPGPDASKDDLMKALQALQVEVQKLREDNRALKEDNKTLLSEKPKRKRQVDAPDELVAHEQTIMLYARKYGMTIEMFPDSDLLSRKCPESPTPFTSVDRYKTVLTRESAFLDELYAHFPSRLHEAMESAFFKNLVLKSISDARSNELKKLRGVAGDIFDLPGKYFTNPHYDRTSITEIQKMLGVSTEDPVYKVFPPLLFPGLQEDLTRKTIFGNWILFAKMLRAALHGVTSLHQDICGGSKTNARRWNFQQVTPGSIAWAAVIAIFLLSPDTEFPGAGTGKTSGIDYKDLFFQYKKILVVKWDTSKRIKGIITNVNQYVFGAAKPSATQPSGNQPVPTEEIDRIMAALDIETDSELSDSVSKSTGAVHTDTMTQHEECVTTVSITAKVHSHEEHHVETVSSGTVQVVEDASDTVPEMAQDSDAIGGSVRQTKTKKTRGKKGVRGTPASGPGTRIGTRSSRS